MKSLSSLNPPQAIILIVGSISLRALENLRTAASYFSIPISHISLSISQYFTLYGSRWPLAALFEPHLPVAGSLQYANQSHASCSISVLSASGRSNPTLTTMIGSEFICRHSLINSSVPNTF